MRGEFEDRALESRFISERSDGRALRADVPLNLPEDYLTEALALRNKLLTYRFHRFAEAGTWFEPVDRTLEPRVNQIFSPLLANIEDLSARELLRNYARLKNATLREERSASIEAQLLAVLRHLGDRAGSIALREIAELYARAYASDAPVAPTPRYVGSVLRKRLGLRPQKSHGVYVVPAAELSKLSSLFDRYNVTEDDAAHVAEFDPGHALDLTFEPIEPPR